MKRGIIICIAMITALVAWSCQSEKLVESHGAKALTIRLKVDDISTGVVAPTRATIPAEAGETTINSLLLFFYEHKSDGSGAWVRTLDETGLGAAAVMNGNYAITFDGEGGFTAGRDYTILALANVKAAGGKNGYLGGESLDGFLDRMRTLTEKQAVEQITVAVEGVDVRENGDDFDAAKIAPDNLLMSTRVVRSKTDTQVEVKLNRGVARFDVYMGSDASLAKYTLVSASVWGAATETPVWYDRMTTTPGRMKRFYGVGDPEGTTSIAPIVGGLYAFENFVSNPSRNDQVTTCLILGFAHADYPGKTYYYRVNINQTEASQNLSRNHVYKITVNSATEATPGTPAGESNEYNAWSQSKTQLNVSVNDWAVDDNGMVITDGVNTMVMPAKLVRLDPRGDVREYTVHTIGDKSLSISKRSLPRDASDNELIKAELIGGSLLRITGYEMANEATELRGSIELCYGELRGTISIVQTPNESKFLEVSRYDVPDHAPIGRGGISDNVPLTVTASGPWTATLYNMSTDVTDPGFSFNPSGTPMTVLRSGSNPFGNSFQVYTTGDNPSNSAKRNGFAVITLDEDPVNFSRVVIFNQGVKQEVGFDPALPGVIRFSPVGMPVSIAGGTAAAGYVVNVNAGLDGQTGGMNHWTVSASGTDRDYFDLQVLPGTWDPHSPVHRFIIRAKGTTSTPQPYPMNNFKHMNLFDRELSASFTVSVGGTNVVFTVIQEKMDISLSTQGTSVTDMGGNIQDVAVHLNSALHWNAEIIARTETDLATKTTTASTHTGYLAVGSSKASTFSDQPAATKLSAGFHKLYYPAVGKSYSMTVRVSVAECPTVYTDFTVTQEALAAAPVKVFDLGGSWGNLTQGDHAFDVYRNYINNRTMYGPKGTMVTTNGTPAATFKNYTATATAIDDGYNYVHLSRPARFGQPLHTVINEWWERAAGESLLVFTADADVASNDNIFLGSTRADKRTTVLSTLGVAHAEQTGRATFATASAAKPVYKYLTADGPAGEVATSGVTFYTDGPRSAASTASMPPNAVPVLMQGTAVAMFIDPQNNLIFIGDCVMFLPTGDFVTAANAAARKWGNDAADAARSQFLVNVLAYVHNAAQYGTHFTDLFVTSPESVARVTEESGGKAPATLYDEAF